MVDTPLEQIGEVRQRSTFFSFRNPEIAFKIPFDDVRSRAFSLTIDVVIESITNIQYLNTRILPDECWYGYATLVHQSFPMELVKLNWGRKRIYSWRDNAALSQWRSHQYFYQTRRDMVAAIANGSDQIPTNLIDWFVAIGRYLFPNNVQGGKPPSLRYEPCSISEVLIEVPKNTQVGIHVNWLEAVPYTANGSSVIPMAREKNSRDDQEAKPDKPKQNDSANPFGGNNPVTPPSPKWQSGNSSNGIASNPVNGRVPVTSGVPIPLNSPISIGPDGKPNTVINVTPSPDGYYDGDPIVDNGDGTGFWRGQAIRQNPDGSWSISLPVDPSKLPSPMSQGMGWKVSFKIYGNGEAVFASYFPWEYLPKGFQIGAKPNGQVCESGFAYWTYTDFMNRPATLVFECIKDVTFSLWN